MICGSGQHSGPCYMTVSQLLSQDPILQNWPYDLHSCVVYCSLRTSELYASTGVLCLETLQLLAS